jgi:hypothetical protein
MKAHGSPARGEKSADIRYDAGNRRFSGALLSGVKRRNRADFERLAWGMLNLEDWLADDAVCYEPLSAAISLDHHGKNREFRQFRARWTGKLTAKARIPVLF